jgi:nucleotide-binding universal stress UspA family protein
MRILYATDGSTQARAAATLLSGLSLSASDNITVLTVGDYKNQIAAEDIFKTAREDLSGTPAVIDTLAREGYPDEEILNACQDLSADLLTVGAKGTSGLARFFLGGVTARVMRYAPCSVLIARPERTSIRRIVMAFDGSDSARAAAALLLAFPLPAEAEVQLLTVLPPRSPYPPSYGPASMPHGGDEFTAIRDLSVHKGYFMGAGRQASTHVEEGDPAASLLDYAEKKNSDLIVLGSHGNGLPERFHRFLLGSVSEKVARYAPCSILLVKRPGE